MLKKNDYILLIALLTLITFISLFLLRVYDDNRLTSWEWVFSEGNAPYVFMLLVCGVLLLIPAVRIQLPERYALFSLFLLSGGASIVFWSVPEVIIDTSRYFIQAKYLELYGIRYFISEWGRGIPAWTDLPLVPFLYGLIFALSGEYRVVIQFFNTLLFSLTIVLTYLIGKELWDKETGFSAGLLLLAIPYLLIQIPLMLVDVPTMFFVAAALYTFLRALKCGTVLTTAVAALAIALSLFSKYSSWPFLVSLLFAAAVFSVSEKNMTPVYIKRGLSVVLCASVLSLLIAANFYDVMAQQLGLLLSFQRPGLRRWEESFISTFFFQMHPFITIAALYSVWAAFKKRDLRYLIIGWVVFLVFVFQIKRMRYLVPLFPMIALMASYGLRRISDADVRRFIVLCAVLSSLTVSYFSYLPFLKNNGMVNLQHAGIFLNTMRTESVEAYVVHSPEDPLNQSVSVPVFDLFTDAKIVLSDDTAPSLPEGAESSSVRFTWEYRNPTFYTDHEMTEKDKFLVLITNRPDAPLTDLLRERLNDYEIQRVFDAYEGIFEYRPVVSVYKRRM